MPKAAVVAGRVILVLITLLFLAPIGGAMAFAAPVLVPLHWVVAKSANKWTRGGWIFLAALSTWEAMWIYVYAGYGEESTALLIVPLLAALTISVLFVATTTLDTSSLHAECR